MEEIQAQKTRYVSANLLLSTNSSCRTRRRDVPELGLQPRAAPVPSLAELGRSAISGYSDKIGAMILTEELGIKHANAFGRANARAYRAFEDRTIRNIGSESNIILSCYEYTLQMGCHSARSCSPLDELDNAPIVSLSMNRYM